ncbi:PLAT/LH2 domain-containing protein [Actinomadura chibensis]|uniref:PLAT domain-containing protein n=1 Tax=Actinomadura chibensis TaxID=392828 RepID=A0A5D0NWP5_9ACTN|nr:PLAT/LH2 domain-containing protein [Actinomadura chibensis]TYB48624.1 hypothetical protein FXF69_05400 [Actinomadura chibensis]
MMLLNPFGAAPGRSRRFRPPWWWAQAVGACVAVLTVVASTAAPVQAAQPRIAYENYGLGLETGTADGASGTDSTVEIALVGDKDTSSYYAFPSHNLCAGCNEVETVPVSEDLGTIRALRIKFTRHWWDNWQLHNAYVNLPDGRTLDNLCDCWFDGDMTKDLPVH